MADTPKTDHHLEPRTKPSESRNILAMVRKACKAKGIPEPAEFLTHVLAGEDPRNETGELYDTVNAIESEMINEFRDAPTAEEWAQIRELVLESGKYTVDRLSIDQSIRAAEKLAEYLYPKLKQIESTQKGESLVHLAPLTEEELKRFRAWFESEF